MRRLLAVAAVLLLSAGIAGALPAGSARAQSAPGMMAVDAGLLFAQALRVQDLAERAELLEEAQAILDRLQGQYPDSQEAAKLRADEKVAGLSPSILAAAREAVRREMEAGGLISPADRDRCLTRPTMSCLYDLAAITARQIESKGRRIAVLAEVAEARAESGELQKALELARPLSYGTPDGPGARALTEIAAMQARAGQLGPAMETAEGLPSRAAVDEARSRLVGVLAAAGALDPAQEISKTIENEGPSIEARTLLALAGVGQPATIDADIEKAHRLSNARESDATLEALAIALAEAGDYRRAATAARQVIDEIRLRRAISTVALAWARAGDVSSALGLARDLGMRNGGARLVVGIAEVRQEAGDFASIGSILDNAAGPEAGVMILNRLAAAPLSAPQAEAWASVAGALLEPGERARGLAMAGRFLAAAGDSAAASARLAQALEASAALDDWERAPVMLEAAAIDLYLGVPNRARERLMLVPAGTFWSDEVAGLADALATLSGPSEVEAVVSALEDEADRQRLLLIATQAMARRDAGNLALAVAATLPEGGIRDQAHFGIAKALLSAGVDPQQAEEVFRRAATLQGDDQLLLEFARTQAAAGDLRGAIRSGERIASPEARTHVYMALAERLRNPLAMQ